MNTNTGEQIIPTTFMTQNEIDFVQSKYGDTAFLNYAQARFSAQRAFALNKQRAICTQDKLRSLTLEVVQTASIALQHVEAGCVPAEMMDADIAIAFSKSTGQLTNRKWSWVCQKLRALTQLQVPEPVRHVQN